MERPRVLGGDGQFVIQIPVGMQRELYPGEGQLWNLKRKVLRPASPKPVYRCSICQDLCKWQDKTLAEFDEGSKEGCSYCALLSLGIRRCVPPEELSDERKLNERLSLVYPKRELESRRENTYGIIVSRVPGDTNDWAGAAIRESLESPPGDTASAGSLEKAKAWIEACQNGHNTCGGGQDRPLPTRLIDVALDETQDVRLLQTADETGRYVCLSHCWGNTESLKTMKANLEQHQQRISWSSLCRTFQDAITFTRGLGVRYLWIDSLCIIQDDSVDWERESGKMASVYRDAHVTLAATKSANHDGGCFTKLDPKFQPHRVSTTDNDGNTISLEFRLRLPHCPYFLNTPLQTQEFPLLARGWVYQERLLSRRIVHFYNNELAWECMQLSDCECGCMGDLENHPGRLARPPFRVSLGLAFNPPKQDQSFYVGESKSLVFLAMRWHTIVQEYTGLKLTFHKDALPALSGLAQEMLRLRKDDCYIAGLWQNTLLNDLTWTAEDDRAPRPDKWRAPSWSWASTTSPVNFLRCVFTDVDTFYPEVKRIIGNIAGEDPTGAVDVPYCIILEATVIPVTLRYADHWAPNGRAAEASASPVGTGSRQPQRRPNPDYEIYFKGKRVGDLDADYLLSCEGQDHVPDGFQVYLLRMARTRLADHFLVLIKVVLMTEGQERSPEDPTVWERIGFLSCYRTSIKGKLQCWKLAHAGAVETVVMR